MAGTLPLPRSPAARISLPPPGGGVPLAAITGAHGIQGEVRLKLLAESLASLTRHASFDAHGRTLTLNDLRDTPIGPIARFAELTTREAAEAVRGTQLTVPRAALPPPEPGETYIADLIGLPARADGTTVGHVVAVENYGAGDLIEVERPSGRRFMLPFARCEMRDGWLDLDPAFVDADA